jgi:hypothetical protein
MVAGGVGLIGYGLAFLYRNFNGFLELGLTPEQVGVTPEQIQAFNMNLYHYISHLQIAIAGFLLAVGVAVVVLAWYGIRAGHRWAAWTALLVPALAVAIALPSHYVWGFASIGHLGVVYVDATLLLVGTMLSLRQTG